MPGRLRFDATGIVCHVINRSAKRQPLFRADDTYAQFVDVLGEATARCPIRLLGFCVMPNHWHLVVWPRGPQDLPRFAHRLTLIHAQRWHRLHGSQGSGAVYQGSYKAIPVQDDRHFYTLLRYVERNPVRAALVEKAEEWNWSSAAGSPSVVLPLSAWPVPRPGDWLSVLNRVERAEELRGLRDRVRHSVPFGDHEWTRAFLAADRREPTRNPL